LRKAVDLDPAHASSLFNLGLVLFERGKTEEAITFWRKAVQAKADYLEALKQLAWVQATHPDPAVRNGAEAVKFAERAVQVGGRQDPAILDLLAAANAEVGRFDLAVQAGREALRLASRAGGQSNVEELKARLALYQAKIPYRRVRSALAPR